MVVLVYWLVPATRRDLPHENGVVEWATALLFLAAAIVGGRRLRDAGASWRDARWIIPVSSLLAMLDEVNWVVFPLGVRRPTLFGARWDGLHDLVEFSVTVIRNQAPWWFILILAIAIAAGVAWAVRKARPSWRLASWRFFALAAGLGVLAQVLDLVTHRNRLAALAEEVLEMDGALAMLFAAWLLVAREGCHGARQWRSSASGCL